MKHERKNQIKVVHEQTAEAFEEKVNRALIRLNNATIEMDRNIPFCAYIFYQTERYYDADTIAECFELYGGGRKCIDCGHFRPTEDRRRKWQPCEFAAYGKTCADANACDLYYIEKMEQWENDRAKVLLDRGRGRAEFSRRRDGRAAL